jgi:UDP-N-acetylglucosamine--N-acetylmuramyl-(pentapeptide) pyrophosphoryl-undecaprenol N-acetylglucosamine transferase
VGTGGYVSGPVIRAAQQLGIKTAIHEQNAFPGVTTKMVASKANRVMLAMHEAQKYLKLNKKPDITGNPIRTELTLKSREEARAILGLTEDKPLILSFGGSLGAKRVNESVAELIKWHNPTDKFYHIHATGKVGYDDMLQNLADTPLSDKVRIREYIDDMDVCMAAADLVICRAGAITLGELQACGKPSVLIPSPYVAENHQFHNAMTLKNKNADEVIEEKDLTGEHLISVVNSLLSNPSVTEEMGKNAASLAITDASKRIYDCIVGLIRA